MLVLPARDRRADRAAPLPRDPPRRDLAAVVEGRRPAPARSRLANGSARTARPNAGPAPLRSRDGGARVANDRIAERQRVFKQYKEDVKERGKPFFPYAMLARHDHVARRRGRDHRARGRLEVDASPATTPSTASGWLGKLYDEPADPGTFNFVPRPDWYFYFLFYLLRIFKWPDVGDPRHGRHPDDLPAPADRAAVHRPAPRAPAAAAAGGDGRGGARDLLDGHPHLQGRDREGGARLGAAHARCRTGRRSRASQTNQAAVAGATLFATTRLPQLPHLPRQRQRATSARPTCPPRARRTRASSSRSRTSTARPA